MQTNQETLVWRFWSHVFSTPNSTSALVKNQGPATRRVVAIGAGMRPGLAYVADVPAPALRSLSFAGVGHIVAEFMAYLTDNGFERGDRVAIFSWNRPEWVWCDLAIQSLGGVTVPIYPNSSVDQASYIIKDAGATFLFAEDAGQLAHADEAILGTATPRKALFADVMKSVPDYSGRTLPVPDINKPVAKLDLVFSARANRSFQEVEAQYQRSANRVRSRFGFTPDGTFVGIGYEFSGDESFLGIKHEDVATIIYTSGSTGVPKGAVLTHGNIASSCQALIKHGFNFSASDIYLSYLPLAHVYERVNGQSMCIWNAVPVAFCRVDELGDQIKVVRPSILCGVPAVWRKMKDKIEHGLSEQTGLKARLIRWAMTCDKPGLKRTIADKLVFTKIRAELGGNLRLIMSGGAAISPEILSFFHLVGLDLRQGYGLTETTGGIAVETPANNRLGSVGKLIDTVEIKLVPEEGDDRPNTGVIWLRGKSVFAGYWHLDAENKKAFDADGWFNTGDLGSLDADGFLFITGRKKRQGKTDGGKYFSPEKIEKAFDSSALVQCLVPTGDGRPFIGALIFVNQLEAKNLLAKQNVTAPAGHEAEFYATNPQIVKAIEEAIATANLKLEHWEKIGQYEIVPAEATVDSGLLTATLKVRSEEVLKRYAALVEKIYSRKR